MNELNFSNPDYKTWLIELKSKIRSTQIKAAIAVNSTLIEFYWDLGKMIAEKQTAWGTNFLQTLSKDLQSEFPEMGGFSFTNLKYCRLFYTYFSNRPQVGDDLKIEKSPELGDELLSLDLNNFDPSILRIPWGHIKLIIGKIKDIKGTKFYIEQTIENNWSRDTLALQIKTNLYERQGKAITNFKGKSFYSSFNWNFYFK